MMYWSVIGDRSHIEESAMDGSLRRVLLDKRLRRPTGMAMHDQCTLYLLRKYTRVHVCISSQHNFFVIHIETSLCILQLVVALQTAVLKLLDQGRF